MKVFHNLNELTPFKRAVVTIGSFDGVHSGHQNILTKVRNLAKDCGGESVLVTFYPHPRHFLFPEQNDLKLITTIEEKKKLLEQFKIDNLVIVPFNKAFAEQSADDYILKFLYEKIRPAFIVIGYDHRFGHKRKGDIEYLKWHSNSLGFEIIEIPKHEVNDIGVSSTKIRQAITVGDIKKANNLLGHNFQLSGQVVTGNKIGRSIGYPTANVDVPDKRKIIPSEGVYAAKVSVKGHVYDSMLYIGTRPTLDNQVPEKRIEVNIFNFDANIYSERINIEFISQIRGDVKFEDLDELKAQLAKDKEDTLKIMKEQNKGLSLIEEDQKKDLPKTAVVLLNYNTSDHLRKYLPSVIEHTPKSVDIIVVDNASTDDSVELMKNEFPEIRLIVNKMNHGFAGGYNEAIKKIDTDILVLLNSDIKVVKGWLEPILTEMEQNPSIAVAQPKILSLESPNLFEYAGAAGGFIDRLGYPFCRGRIFTTVEEDWGQYEEKTDVFWASGAAFFIRKKIYDHFEGFDETYFAHMEEIDLCWRIKRAGYRVVAVPSSKVYHLGGGTLAYGSARKTYLNVRNSLFTLLKNESRKSLFSVFVSRILLDGLAGIYFFLKFEFKHIKAIIKAHWEVFPQISKRLKMRKHDEALIEKIRIAGPQEDTGRIKGSVLLTYFLSGKKKFKDLKFKQLDQSA
jgi:riboflavin kinase/FMN adenylyltransferase